MVKLTTVRWCIYQIFPNTKGTFSSFQSLSYIWLFVTPWTAACQASLSITNFQSLLKLVSVESMMPSKHLILCRPLFLLPSIFPSIRAFSSESVLRIRWLKYWSFSISSSNEYSGLIFFRIDWFDFHAVQGTLKRLLQHHSSKASILRCSCVAVLHHLLPTVVDIMVIWIVCPFDSILVHWFLKWWCSLLASPVCSLPIYFDSWT